jgi:hypothetical protein
MKPTDDLKSDLKLIAREVVQVLDNAELKPDERGLKLTRIMLSMAKMRYHIEQKRAALVIREKKVFSRILEDADARSREERMAKAKGSDEVMIIASEISEVDAIYTEVKLIIAAIKHAILISRGQMGMKE